MIHIAEHRDQIAARAPTIGAAVVQLLRAVSTPPGLSTFRQARSLVQLTGSGIL